MVQARAASQINGKPGFVLRPDLGRGLFCAYAGPGRPSARTTIDRERSANMSDVFGTERRESAQRNFSALPLVWVGGRPRRGRGAPERYVSASDRYGDAAFVPRKAKHVRFLQRSAFFLNASQCGTDFLLRCLSTTTRGGVMHQSTWVILLFLMAGEIVILAIGGFVLWLIGEFGDAPKWLRSRHLRKGRRAQ